MKIGWRFVNSDTKQLYWHIINTEYYLEASLLLFFYKKDKYPKYSYSYAAHIFI